MGITTLDGLVIGIYFLAVIAIAAVFLLGLLWKRLNAAGAMASLVTGFVLGMARLVLELSKEDLSGFLYAYATINFLNFAAILFVVCAAVLILVSLITKPPTDEHVRGLTFQTARQGATGSETDAARTVSEPAWRRHDAVLSVVTVILVLAVMIYFSSLFFDA